MADAAGACSSHFTYLKQSEASAARFCVLFADKTDKLFCFQYAGRGSQLCKHAGECAQRANAALELRTEITNNGERDHLASSWAAASADSAAVAAIERFGGEVLVAKRKGTQANCFVFEEG